jgi:hypothetical protein
VGTVVGASTDAEIAGTTFTLTIDSPNVKVADSAFDGATAKNLVVAYSGVKLSNSGLVSPALSFHIGVITARSL